MTFNFWIAAISDAVMGEFSERVWITYDGKSDMLEYLTKIH